MPSNQKPSPLGSTTIEEAIWLISSPRTINRLDQWTTNMENISSKDFTSEEWRAIQKYSAAAEQVASKKGGINSEEWNMASLAETADIDIVTYPKESLMMHALWVIFFSHLRRLNPPSELKYQSVSSFLETYGGKFNDHPNDDQRLLCETANWMNEMFKYLSARKNKGLAIQMIPKLVEGWHAKYVTGSGQTKATADRVFIFEKEGGVQPAHRGGGRACSSSKKTAYRGKPRRQIGHNEERVGSAFSSTKKRRMKFKSGLKQTYQPPSFCPSNMVSKVSSCDDYDHADTDMDTDASGASEDLYSHLTLNSVACQHSSNEMNEYFDIFRNVMALPSSNNLALEISPTTNVTHPPLQNRLGTALALGPSNFQPLFDFSLQGGPAPLMLPTAAAQKAREQGWQGGSPLPPPLKRAYSWESDYNMSEYGDSKDKTPIVNNGIENNPSENGVDKILEPKISAAAKHAAPTFLFDEYLISHP